MPVVEQPSAARGDPRRDPRGDPGRGAADRSPRRGSPRWHRVAGGDRSESAAERHAGYVAAVIVNAVLLWVAHQLLDWEWPSFLTPEFEEVLPIVSASIVASMVANALFVLHDPQWLKSLLEAVSSAIGLAASIRMLQVFPFDFSSWGTDWSWLVRTALVVGVVVAAIAMIANTARLLDEAIRLGHPDPRQR